MSESGSKEITNRERIKRIIGILRLDGREIEIHFPRYIEIAKISDTTQEMFSVKLSNSLVDLSEEDLQSLYIAFVFSGVELFGKCRVISHTNSAITLDYPDSLMSRSKRRHPRVRFSHIVSAKLKFKQYPEKKSGMVSSKELPVKYSKLYWEVQRESVDIKKIFLLVGAEIKKISHFSEINLYNRETLQTRDAQILRKSGKVLYVDDCRKIQSYTRFIPSDKIISYNYYLNEKRIQGIPREEVIDELKEIVKENLAQKLTSKALVPIFSKGEVIGQIKGVQKEGGKKISYGNAADFMSLGALLTMGIEKAGFVPDLGDTVQSNLVDVSEGGMLIRIVNDSNMRNIQEGTELEIKFFIKGREVTLKGSVTRKDDQTKGFAIQFSDLGSMERQSLKSFIDENIDKLKEKG